MIEHDQTYQDCIKIRLAEKRQMEQARMEEAIARQVGQAQREAARRHKEACKPAAPEPSEIDNILSALLEIVEVQSRLNVRLGERVTKLRGAPVEGQADGPTLVQGGLIGQMQEAIDVVKAHQSVASALLASLEEVI